MPCQFLHVELPGALSNNLAIRDTIDVVLECSRTAINCRAIMYLIVEPLRLINFANSTPCTSNKNGFFIKKQFTKNYLITESCLKFTRFINNVVHVLIIFSFCEIFLSSSSNSC